MTREAISSRTRVVESLVTDLQTLSLVVTSENGFWACNEGFPVLIVMSIKNVQDRCREKETISVVLVGLH